MFGAAGQVLVAGGDLVRAHGDFFHAAMDCGHGAGQAFLHALDGREHLSDFVAVANVDAAGEIAFGDFLEAGAGFLQGAQDHAAHEQPGQQCQAQGNRNHGEDHRAGAFVIDLGIIDHGGGRLVEEIQEPHGRGVEGEGDAARVRFQRAVGLQIAERERAYLRIGDVAVAFRGFFKFGNQAVGAFQMGIPDEGIQPGIGIGLEIDRGFQFVSRVLVVLLFQVHETVGEQHARAQQQQVGVVELGGL